MIKRIDLFMPPESKYGVLHHFTEKLGEALKKIGVEVDILTADRTNPKPFLEKIFNNPPDCTLSFNGLLPDKKGRFFCDMIKIPHVAYLVDSPNQFFSLGKSPYSIITCPDRFACEFFQGMNCENVLFMPHAIEKKLKGKKKKQIYDVVMLSSCIDYEAIQELWKKSYSKVVCEALTEAGELALSDTKTSYIQAFVQVLDDYVRNSKGIDPTQLNFFEILDELEDYVKGKDRVQLVKSIKDAKIDIFSSTPDLWKKYLKGQSNVTIHDQVTFDQAIDIMQQSKIVLNSYPSSKNGAHERIFLGLAAGALVITNDNIYMHENFKDGHDIVFHHYGKKKETNETVNEYLSNEKKRKEVAERGRKNVLKNHTWDARAKKLVKELEPILKRIKETTTA